jgi:hypothetical protein
VRRDRVVGLRITGARWRSERGGLRVGARLDALRTALPRAWMRGPGRYHATLPVAGGGSADILVRVVRGRVTRIAARLNGAVP